MYDYQIKISRGISRAMSEFAETFRKNYSGVWALWLKTGFSRAERIGMLKGALKLRAADSDESRRVNLRKIYSALNRIEKNEFGKEKEKAA